MQTKWIKLNPRYISQVISTQDLGNSSPYNHRSWTHFSRQLISCCVNLKNYDVALTSNNLSAVGRLFGCLVRDNFTKFWKFSVHFFLSLSAGGLKPDFDMMNNALQNTKTDIGDKQISVSTYGTSLLSASLRGAVLRIKELSHVMLIYIFCIPTLLVRENIDSSNGYTNFGLKSRQP